MFRRMRATDTTTVTVSHSLYTVFHVCLWPCLGCWDIVTYYLHTKLPNHWWVSQIQMMTCIRSKSCSTVIHIREQVECLMFDHTVPVKSLDTWNGKMCPNFWLVLYVMWTTWYFANLCFACVCVCVCMCICTCIYVCVCVCICVYVYEI